MTLGPPEDPSVGELEPGGHRPLEIAEAIDECDDTWTALDEHFTSTGVQQLRWGSGGSKQTKKRERINAFVREAVQHLGKTPEEMSNMPDEFRRP